MLNFILFVFLVVFLVCAVAGISAFLVDVFKYRQPLEKSIKHCSADEADAEPEAQAEVRVLTPEEEQKREEVKKIANDIFDSFGN